MWEVWEGDNQKYNSCAIITTKASDQIENIHHRMPIILQPEAYDQWLDPEKSMYREVKGGFGKEC